MKKALLVISFGTAYKKTRERTIEAIENDFKNAFSDCFFYRAWTSDFIIKKLKRDEDLHIDTVIEAMERMIRDGVTDAVIQPTHLICGTEYNNIKEIVTSYKDRFSSVKLGTPLLSDYENIRRLAKIMESEFSHISEDEMLALMGHGSENLTPNPYEELNKIFKNDGYPNFCTGTVEFEPNFEPISDKIHKLKPKKAVLAPLLIVAGCHAVSDMAGDSKTSWKSLIEAEGVETECVLKGLGEYKKFREMYISHTEKM